MRVGPNYTQIGIIRGMIDLLLSHGGFRRRRGWHEVALV
jgi:hypothetical protein